MNRAQQALRTERGALVRELEQTGAKFTGNKAICPFHQDHRPSAGIFQGQDEAWRFKCQACGVHGDIFDMRSRIGGRPLADVLREVGDEEPKRTASASKQPRVLADLDAVRAALPGHVVLEHPYRRLNGDVAMVVFRVETVDGKSYRPAIPCNGGWALKALPRPYPLYCLPELYGAETIVIVEGEKCCDVWTIYGIVASTSPFGASSAKQSDWSPLAGKNVIIWRDNDPAGVAYEDTVKSLLLQLQPAPRISIVNPARLDLGDGEDVVDYVDQMKVLGKTSEEISATLRRVLGEAKPQGPLDSYRRRQVTIARGEIRCIAWVHPYLTKWTRALQPGRVTMMAGKKGSAKSFLSEQNQLAWLQGGESAAVMILEGSIDEYLDRALAQLDGNANLTDFDWVRDNVDEAQAAIDRHADELAQLKASVTRAGINITLDQVADWIDQQAKQGRRLISVDPVSAAVRTGKPWDVDAKFLNRVRATAEEHGCSVVLITHLQKGASEFTPDALAGSACYERFSDTIIQLHRHDMKTAMVKTSVGRMDVTHNLTVFIEKARAPGSGLKLAYDLDPQTLCLHEHGIILKKSKD